MIVLKKLISRKFLSVMEIAEILSRSLTLFSQKIRESNGFTKEITRVNMTKFFSVRENFSFFHNVWSHFYVY